MILRDKERFLIGKARMDFLEQAASDEVKVKVSLIARFFDSYAMAVKETANMIDDDLGQVVVGLVATTILAHAVELFSGMGEPETVTVGKCYDLMFEVNGKSVAFIEQVEQSLEEVGIVTLNMEGDKPSEVLRQLVTA